jgi:hypothetical protein
MKLSNGYSISVENYHKPTPKWLKIVADILLGSILVLDPLIMSIPDFEQKEWILFGWNVFVALFKLVSKTITDANAQVQ